MIITLSQKQARMMLEALSGPSVTDPELAKLYEQIAAKLKKGK